VAVLLLLLLLLGRLLPEVHHGTPQQMHVGGGGLYGALVL
jgi:hypothetical protein